MHHQTFLSVFNVLCLSIWTLIKRNRFPPYNQYQIILIYRFHFNYPNQYRFVSYRVFHFLHPRLQTFKSHMLRSGAILTPFFKHFHFSDSSLVTEFHGNSSHTDHFKLLKEDGTSVLVGARNIIYNLSLPDLQEYTEQVRGNKYFFRKKLNLFLLYIYKN